jgi:recombination protein RecA
MRRRSFAQKTPRSALAAVADRFGKFRPAKEVLTKVRAVPTRFVQFDHAVRVGGWPIERFSLVHGPSNEGKTSLVLGLADSFLEGDHFVLYLDAERTTPFPWVRSLLGERAEHPGFYAERPDTYEGTIAKVRLFLNTVANLRETGKVPPETSALVIVDSLRKLVPADMMKEILAYAKEEKKDRGKPGSKKREVAITAGRDRSGQIKAKMNAAWMDEVVPLLEHAQAGMVAIGREMVDPDADARQRMFGNDYKVGGGGSVIFDASLVARVERASWVTLQKEEGERADVYGERHRITIKKTKVAGKDDKVVVCHFHTSNGVLVPEGFDRARDVLELGEKFGVVEASGAWLSWNGTRLGQGRHQAVRRLTADGPALAALEAAVRERFKENAPEEVRDGSGDQAQGAR